MDLNEEDIVESRENVLDNNILMPNNQILDDLNGTGSNNVGSANISNNFLRQNQNNSRNNNHFININQDGTNRSNNESRGFLLS